jgi:hypothetical protein
MARHRDTPSSPHGIPRVRTCSIGPRDSGRPAELTPRRRRIFRAPLIAGLALALLGQSGCGRTDFVELADVGIDGDDELAVDFRRELTLDDESIVLVELMAPALALARTGVEELDDGVSMSLLIDTVCPDGEPELVFDTTGDIPALLVYRESELRGVIWM